MKDQQSLDKEPISFSVALTLTYRCHSSEFYGVDKKIYVIISWLIYNLFRENHSSSNRLSSNFFRILYE